MMKNFFIYFAVIGIFFSLNGNSYGQTSSYTFETVVCTGVAIGCNSSYTSLSKGPSINNNGKVAFITLDTNNYKRVFLVNNGTAERNYPIGPQLNVGNYLQVNDSDKITWQDSVPGANGDTYIRRLDDNVSGVVIAWARYNDLTAFEYVMPFPSLSNTGLVAFGGDLQYDIFNPNIPRTVLASRAGGTGSYNKSPALSNFPNFYPMVDSYNDTVVKYGGNTASPVYFMSTNLQTGIYMANSTDYNAIGNKPGVSDNGFIVGIMGNHKTLGPGVYIRVDNTGGHTFVGPFKVSDITADTSLDNRVGINKLTNDSSIWVDYIVTYMAKNPTNGALGLYARKVNIANPGSPVIYPAVLLAEVGQTIGDFSITVSDIYTYDPVNNHGEIVFWVKTAANTQAVIKAKPNIYTIMASAGTGGTINPSGSVALPLGATQIFTITPNSNYQISQVLVDGVVQSPVPSSYTFTNINANHTIAASFVHNPVTITANAGIGGRISPSGNVSVAYEANQIFTITPSRGYRISRVLVDGVAVTLSSNTYTFTNVTANHTIAASFATICGDEICVGVEYKYCPQDCSVPFTTAY